MYRGKVVVPNEVKKNGGKDNAAVRTDLEKAISACVLAQQLLIYKLVNGIVTDLVKTYKNNKMWPGVKER